MDSFEFNKIAGAVLGTLLFVLTLSIISEMIYAPLAAKQPGFVVAIVNEPAHGAAPVEVQPIAVRLASANEAAGEELSKKCLACHTLEKGQPAKVGPNLWNIVGSPIAHMATFKYSDAMLREKAKDQTWTYEHLDAFIAAPGVYVPGTIMGFGGLTHPSERADLIAYLRTLADTPVPLPSVPAATPAVAPNPNAPPRSEPLPPPAGGAPASTPTHR